MSDHPGDDPPSAFVAEWIARLAAGNGQRRALDAPMGRGRHAELLTRSGYRVFGVDWQTSAVREAATRLGALGLPMRAWVADLTQHPLPPNWFDLIIVTRYLQRDLFPALREAVVPGGVVLYETFTEQQRRLGRGPTSPHHLLRSHELRHYFDEFEILFYEEVESPEAVARVAARRREPSSAK